MSCKLARLISKHGRISLLRSIYFLFCLQIFYLVLTVTWINKKNPTFFGLLDEKGQYNEESSDVVLDSAVLIRPTREDSSKLVKRMQKSNVSKVTSVNTQKQVLYLLD